jgi:Tfp pilus assembly protein PilF
VVQRAGEDYPAAAASLARALQLYRDLGERPGEAQALNHQGELSLASGEPAEARDRYEEALAIAVSIAARPEQARALEGLGRCHLQDGQPDRAAERLRQALDIYQRAGSPDADRVQELLRDHGL